jgi:hypothetical protein
MRLAPLLAPACALALIAAPAAADAPSRKPEKPTEQAAPTGQEPGIYRFGATYSVLPGDTPTACQASCAADEMCLAWSHVAAIDGGEGRCELKRGGGHVRKDLLSVSGISPRHEALFTPKPVQELDGGPDADGE